MAKWECKNLQLWTVLTIVMWSKISENDLDNYCWG